MDTADRTSYTRPDRHLQVREIPIHFSPPPAHEMPPHVHPDSAEVYRKAFAAELEHLPDIRDRLVELAQRAGYEADVEVAISSITDAADEIIDAVEADDPGALAGE